MNLGRFANFLSMMTNRLMGVVPQASSLTPLPPPPAEYILFSDTGSFNFVTGDGDKIIFREL